MCMCCGFKWSITDDIYLEKMISGLDGRGFFAEKQAVMKCMKCGKEIFKSITTEAIELGFGVLVIRNIPCYKCTECDEIFYTGDIIQKIDEITERVKLLAQEVTVVDFEKAA